MTGVRIANLSAVGIFGMVLSAAFCDIAWTRRKVLAMSGSIAAILLFQGLIYFGIDSDIVEKVYPLITHLPLTVVLWILTRKGLWSAVSVLTAYLCCQLRRWLALLVMAVFSGGTAMQNITELVLTLPILVVLIRFIAPSVRSVSHCRVLLQCQFGLVPALYYGFDYLTRIYTDLLLKGVLVAIEFMPFVCSVSYLFFVVHTSDEQKARLRLEQTHAILNLQVGQAVREIAALREAQEKTSAYRHDMRHHMQYLSSCIENGQYRQAQEYIQKIDSMIEAGRVTAFCENETTNLILSTYAKRAGDSGILMQVQARLPRLIPVSETDLCVLLSNALENALNACMEQTEKGRAGVIEVSMYAKNRRIFLQIVNSCGGDVVFEDGIPVTGKAGHGFGTRSICAIVEQYNGMYSFSSKDGQFILRVSI